MRRTALLCALLCGVLGAAAAPVTAGHSSGGTIVYEGGLDMCVLIATHEDGSSWFALVSRHDTGHSLQPLGDATFADDPVGWICTWSVDHPLPVSEPLVLTGLTCRFEYPYYPTASGIRPGTLTSSGTAIIANGTIRLICPAGERLPLP